MAKRRHRDGFRRRPTANSIPPTSAGGYQRAQGHGEATAPRQTRPRTAAWRHRIGATFSSPPYPGYVKAALVLLVIFSLVAAAVSLTRFASQMVAHFGEPTTSVEHVDIDLTVTESGTARIVETFTYDYAEAAGQGMRRHLPHSGAIGEAGWHDLGLTNVSARSLEEPMPVDIRPGSTETYIEVGDFEAEPTLTGRHRFEIAYTYERLVVHDGDDVSLNFDAIGRGWVIDIQSVAVTVRTPGQPPKGAFADPPMRAGCRAWQGNYSEPCDEITFEHPEDGLGVRFTHGLIEPGGALNTWVTLEESSVVNVPAPRPAEEPTSSAFAMAPETRALLAHLGWLALAGGFLTVAATAWSTLSQRRASVRWVAAPVSVAGGTAGADLSGAGGAGAGGGGGGGGGAGGGGGG
ncbi:DUF2207 domain-containing protein [Natronoglycomyces albus]|uniref:DUF2207 domain-containing protein n=1 Tax=Natronoglycomyces albus TaxID=2811108 RepID=A0A895XRR7_9ACTN|nr:DUF2207 domain-containing protein [Natronoglycomyces albus]QSB05256.1 DUF2207 domain-containing protein [Natronoglycomyces albus]